MTQPQMQRIATQIVAFRSVVSLLVDEELHRVCLVGDILHADSKQGKIIILDGNTGQVVQELQVGHHLVAATIDQRHHHMYVLDDGLMLDRWNEASNQAKPGQILRIDITTGQLVNTVMAEILPSLLTYDASQEKLFFTVADAQSNRRVVKAFDAQSQNVHDVGSIPDQFIGGLQRFITLDETGDHWIVGGRSILVITPAGQVRVVYPLPNHEQSIDDYVGKGHNALYFLTNRDGGNETLFSLDIADYHYEKLLEIPTIAFDVIDSKRGMAYFHTRNETSPVLLASQLNETPVPQLRVLGPLPPAFRDYQSALVFFDAAKQRLCYKANTYQTNAAGEEIGEEHTLTVIDLPAYNTNPMEGIASLRLEHSVNGVVTLHHFERIVVASVDAGHILISLLDMAKS